MFGAGPGVVEEGHARRSSCHPQDAARLLEADGRTSWRRWYEQRSLARAQVAAVDGPSGDRSDVEGAARPDRDALGPEAGWGAIWSGKTGEAATAGTAPAGKAASTTSTTRAVRRTTQEVLQDISGSAAEAADLASQPPPASAVHSTRRRDDRLSAAWLRGPSSRRRCTPGGPSPPQRRSACGRE